MDGPSSQICPWCVGGFCKMGDGAPFQVVAVLRTIGYTDYQGWSVQTEKFGTASGKDRLCGVGQVTAEQTTVPRTPMGSFRGANVCFFRPPIV